jgi:hypothetical protein
MNIYEVIRCDYKDKEERFQKTIPANKVLTWCLVILVDFFVSLRRRGLCHLIPRTRIQITSTIGEGGETELRSGRSANRKYRYVRKGNGNEWDFKKLEASP